jgi:hypothetical protein
MPEQLTRLAAVLRATPKIEQRELRKSMRRAARPLLRTARQGALQILPYRGGLAERVAAGKFTSQVSFSGDRTGIQITAADRRGADVNRMDDGSVRHPVYGNRRRWVTQAIRPGWFSEPLLLDAPKVRDEIEKALDTTAATMVSAV